MRVRIFFNTIILYSAVLGHASFNTSTHSLSVTPKRPVRRGYLLSQNVNAQKAMQKAHHTSS